MYTTPTPMPWVLPLAPKLCYSSTTLFLTWFSFSISNFGEHTRCQMLGHAESFLMSLTWFQYHLWFDNSQCIVLTSPLSCGHLCLWAFGYSYISPHQRTGSTSYFLNITNGFICHPVTLCIRGHVIFLIFSI